MNIHVREDIMANVGDELGIFLTEYQTVITAFYAFAVITVIIIIILNVTKLAKAGDNPQERSEAIHGILVSGICFAILGSLGFVFMILVSFLL